MSHTDVEDASMTKHVAVWIASGRDLHASDELTVEDDPAVRSIAELYGCTVQDARDAIRREGPSRVAVELALACSGQNDERSET